MRAPEEIVLPETQPETEWVRGRALQKVSPTYPHASLQLVIGSARREWARGRGRVGTEWRFRVNPPGEPVRPLVPDVAYLAYARLPREAEEAARVPLGAPSVAVEILSADDRAADIIDKTATYLRAGCDLVIVVDPVAEQMVAVDRGARVTFMRGGTFQHTALPGWSVDVTALFDDARY